jgi:outer membrane protein assembly factor BamB
MWRRGRAVCGWLAIGTIAVAGCSSGEAEQPTTPTQPPSFVTVPGLSDDELAVVPTSTVPSTSIEPAHPPLDGPADPRSDPFGARAYRPLLPSAPVERWSITIDRSTFPTIHAVADLLVLHRITPDDDHSLIALDRDDGSITWEYDPDDSLLVDVIGQAILVQLRSPGDLEWVVVDPFTGVATPFAVDGQPWFGTDYVTFVAFDRCRTTFHDTVDLSVVGQFCAAGVGPETFTERVDDGIVERSPADLSVVSDVIPVPPGLPDRTRFMVIGDAVVASSSAEVSVFRRDGTLIGSAPNPGEIMVVPAGAGSDAVMIYAHVTGQTVAYDVTDLDVLWTRPGVVDVFGVVDGAPLGLFSSDAGTEVFDLETGDTRCVIDDGVRPAENALYSFEGVVYGLDCVERWSVDRGDDAVFTMVDDGVLIVERVDDAGVELRFLS